METKFLCRIVVENELEFNLVKPIVSKYPCELLMSEGCLPDEDIPTLYVGWAAFKNKITGISILKKEISGNSQWCYSSVENSEDHQSSIGDFIKKSIFSWLPNKITHVDPMFVDMVEFTEYIKRHKVYAYHHDGALYINSNEENFCINLKNLYLMTADPRGYVVNILDSLQIFAFSQSNLLKCSREGMRNFESLEDICWIKFGVEISENTFFRFDIENLELWKYIPFMMSKLNEMSLDPHEEQYMKRMWEKNKITSWLSEQFVPFDYTFENKNLNFVQRNETKFTKFNFSNKRTITGRIVCKDEYNIQNIQRESLDKKFIKSSLGGNIVAMDYVSFETRISMYMTKDNDFINKFWNKDIHYEAAKILYNTINITKEMREVAKNIVHSILYGAGENLIFSKMDGSNIQRDRLYHLKFMLKPILLKVVELEELLKKDGHLINKWGTIVRPNKSYAAYNNYIQTAASEIMTDKLFEIRNLLSGKQSKLLFQVIDNIVFDIHPLENHLINDINNAMSNVDGMFFPVDTKVGKNYSFS